MTEKFPLPCTTKIETMIRNSRARGIQNHRLGCIHYMTYIPIYFIIDRGGPIGDHAALCSVVFSEKKPAVLNTKTQTFVPQNRISYLISIFRTVYVIMSCTNNVWCVFVRPGAYWSGSHAETRLFGGWERIIFRHNTKHTSHII